MTNKFQNNIILQTNDKDIFIKIFHKVIRYYLTEEYNSVDKRSIWLVKQLIHYLIHDNNYINQVLI